MSEWTNSCIPATSCGCPGGHCSSELKLVNDIVKYKNLGISVHVVNLLKLDPIRRRGYIKKKSKYLTTLHISESVGPCKQAQTSDLDPSFSAYQATLNQLKPQTLQQRFPETKP